MPRDLSSFVKTKVPLNEFSHAVILTVLKIPQGKVATYGQIAELAGFPQRPRQVGMVLRFIVDVDRVPWHRVLGAGGRILFPKRNKNFKLQRKLLEEENVRFINDTVDLDKYGWRKKVPTARNHPKMFSK